MRVTTTSITGCLTLAPDILRDERGSFLRVFSSKEYAEAGIDHVELVQENQSRSRRGTVRGLHMRTELRESKLVRVAHGEIYDVIVDLRPWSPSFLRWERFILDDRTHVQLWVPPGCAHGFQALSEEADVCYRVDAAYDSSMDVALAYDDEELAIPWPLPHPIISPRDRMAPPLAQLRAQLEAWYGTSEPSGQPRPDPS